MSNGLIHFVPGYSGRSKLLTCFLLDHRVVRGQVEYLRQHQRT